MESTTQLVSEEHLFLIPDDGYRYEVVEGELRRMTLTGFEHGRSTGNFHRLLSSHVHSHKLGYVLAAETGFIIGRTDDGRVTVRAADVSYVATGRIPAAADTERYLELAPDLVVETLSPSDTAVEMEDKVARWLVAGVRCVVILNPAARSASVCRSQKEMVRLKENEELDLADVVPGFRCKVSDIFD